MTIALLPLADMEMAVAGFRRVRSELDLIGAILPANVLATRDEAGKMSPLFEAAEDLGGHIFVHPGLRSDQFPPPDLGGRPRFADSVLARMALQVQSNLGHATVTLTCTDFLEPYGRVTVQVTNLGGTLPAVVERMDHAAKIRMPDSAMPLAGLGRVYVDCALLGPRAIEAASAAFGAERLLLGIDCLIFRTDLTIDAVAAANIPKAECNALLAGNAQALLTEYST